MVGFWQIVNLIILVWLLSFDFHVKPIYATFSFLRLEHWYVLCLQFWLLHLKVKVNIATCHRRLYSTILAKTDHSSALQETCLMKTEKVFGWIVDIERNGEYRRQHLDLVFWVTILCSLQKRDGGKTEGVWGRGIQEETWYLEHSVNKLKTDTVLLHLVGDMELWDVLTLGSRMPNASVLVFYIVYLFFRDWDI